MTKIPSIRIGFCLAVLSCLFVHSVQAQTTVTYTADDTFTVPAGVSQITVEVWGAGGGGGRRHTGGGGATQAAGGGGGGGFRGGILMVSEAEDIDILIGAAGVGATTTLTDGGDGGSSSATRSSDIITATGGSGGQGATARLGGPGGGGSFSGTVGSQVSFAGGDAGRGGGRRGGGGGGGAGNAAVGSNGTNGGGSVGVGGAGGNANGGDGGDGAERNTNAEVGSVYGGGGGGAADNNSFGGDGAGGYVTITYTIVLGSSTWYSYQSGDWDNAASWTLDGAINPLYDNPSGYTPSTSPSSSVDNVVIQNGNTITVQSGNNNKANPWLEVLGTIDFTTTTGHTFTIISGGGRVELSSDNFPSGDASLFGGSTGDMGAVVYEGTGYTLSTIKEFYDVEINQTNASDIVVLMADYTINGDLTITQGEFQINDNSSTTILNLTVNNDLTVEANGEISVGTGNTINGAFDIVTSEGTSTLPTTGNYHSIYHQFTIGGDFNNLGTVRFTNQTNPDYDDFSTTGAVNVYFTGTANNSVQLDGQTDFYNLVVDKGSDQTYILEINSSSTSNFRLFGPNVLVHFPNVFVPAAVGDLTVDNPEVRKPIWIKNGTLKLTGQVSIPTLSEDIGFQFQFYNDFIIPQNGRLWLAGDNVSVNSTALTTDTEVSGHSGVGDTYWGQGLAVIGKLQVTAGGLDMRNSWEGLIYYAGVIAPEILIEGGSVTAGWLRDQFGGKASYIQTGGTATFTGGATQPTTVRFGITSSDMTFQMSGGEIVLGGNGRPIVFIVASDESNYDVTGGKVIFNMEAAGSTINTTANLWDVEVNSAVGSQTLTMEANLEVSNDLTIDANSTLDADNTNDYNLTVGADFEVASGGSYLHRSNTTTLDGDKVSNLSFPTLQTFNNLTINKLSSGDKQVNIITGADPAIRVTGEFRLESGLLEYNTFNMEAQAAVYLADTVGNTASTGSLSLNGGSNQTLTSAAGVVGNLTIDNANDILLASDSLTITNTLTLTTGVFDIDTEKLIMAGASANISGSGFSSSKMIETAGNASDGGMAWYIDANETVTFPLGSGGKFTPAATVVTNFMDDGYVRINPVEGVLSTTANGGGNVLSYYWRVRPDGFTSLPTVQHVFNYDETDDDSGDEGNFVPGKVLANSPFTRSYEDDNITESELINGVANIISFDGPLDAGFTLEEANYTAGVAGRFIGAPSVFYTKTTQDDGFFGIVSWTLASSWTRSDLAGFDPTSPQPIRRSRIEFISRGW